MNSNRKSRWVASVGIPVAAGLIGLAPAARADDMQISIDGYDLFPTAGNTATALSDPGDMAIAIGNGASASALNDPAETGNFGNFAFADGTGETANAGGGIFDTALTLGGTDSTTYAGFNGNFDLALATASNDTVAAGVGTQANPANFDLASAVNPGYIVYAGPGAFQVESAAAVPAADPASTISSLGDSPPADLGPFEDLFGDTGFNSWTPSADSFLASVDPTLAANFDTSVDNFLAGVPGGDDPITVLVGDFDSSAFSGFPLGLGEPINPVGDLAVGLDYSIFASGLAPTLDPALGSIDGLVALLLGGGLPCFIECLGV